MEEGTENGVYTEVERLEPRCIIGSAVFDDKICYVISGGSERIISFDEDWNAKVEEKDKEGKITFEQTFKADTKNADVIAARNEVISENFRY